MNLRAAAKKLAWAVGGLLIAISAFLYRNFTAIDQNPMPFDALAWKRLAAQTEQIDPGCVRGGMALTLVEQRALTGLSRPQLAELLGTDALQHGLGQCHWGGAHSHLVITLDSSERVSGARIHRF